jgi:putative SOS response-associated peptidase YedK
LETFTILTTSPNAAVQPYHDRMPVIIDIDKAIEWLAGS